MTNEQLELDPEITRRMRRPGPEPRLAPEAEPGMMQVDPRQTQFTFGDRP